MAAWDIDVRPDWGPARAGHRSPGGTSGGQARASCHGVFGESNSVFSPLVGGTTAGTSRPAASPSSTTRPYPDRTTLMKVPTVPTLWDYINRAMPWTAPKSLASADEVYAVTAFLLNLAAVVPDDFTLSRRTIAEAQAKMPNRNGMTAGTACGPGHAQDVEDRGQSPT